jgi:hypothetical protein
MTGVTLKIAKKRDQFEEKKVMPARGHVVKAALTAEEKLRVAYGSLILGISQHDLTALFGVNQGRVNEAVKAVATACEWPSPFEDPEEGTF